MLDVKYVLTLTQYELMPDDEDQGIQNLEDTADPAQRTKRQMDRDMKRKAKAHIVVEHLDIIKEDFWNRRPWILSNKPGKVPKET